MCASSAINNNRFLGNVANSLNTLSLTNDAYVDIITYDALSGSIVSLSFMRSISDCHDGYLEHTFTMYIEKNGKILNADLQVDEDRTIKLLVNTKKNNPKVWADFHDNILLPNELVNIEDLPLKRDERRISAALIKNAYLLLFARTGYSLLYDTYYDDLRKQILDPDVFHLPDRLWTIQNISIPDGIYLTQDNKYRGFFVIYTLELKFKYRVCVLIPTPMIPYLAATKELEKIDAHTRIKILSLPDLDYLNNDEAIKRLREWCYSWKMKL